MVQHLRGSGRHLTAARMPDPDRARFNRLLAGAVHRAEGRLRDRLRPEIARTLDASPERVEAEIRTVQRHLRRAGLLDGNGR